MHLGALGLWGRRGKEMTAHFLEAFCHKQVNFTKGAFGALDFSSDSVRESFVFGIQRGGANPKQKERNVFQRPSKK